MGRRDFLYTSGSASDGIFFARWKYQQVLVLRRTLNDSFHQALHVSANAGIFDSAQVKSDLHFRQLLLPQSGSGGQRLADPRAVYDL